MPYLARFSLRSDVPYRYCLTVVATRMTFNQHWSFRADSVGQISRQPISCHSNEGQGTLGFTEGKAFFVEQEGLSRRDAIILDLWPAISAFKRGLINAFPLKDTPRGCSVEYRVVPNDKR